jgi:zinc transporter 1/2/3
MNPVLFKFLAGTLILIVTLVCGLGPIRKWWKKAHSHTLALAEAFAGGIFLGVALFHMLPDSTRAFQQLLGQDAYPYGNLFCAVGFMFLLGMENIILRVVHHRQNPIPFLLAAVLSIHALIEGSALGINTSFADTVLIFIAIIVHKGSESLALAANFARNSTLPKHAMVVFLIFASMTPLGILMGDLLAETSAGNHNPFLEPTFNALAAGTFLYIATLHKIHHQHIHECLGNLKEYTAMTIGLIAMAVLAIWI